MKKQCIIVFTFLTILTIVIITIPILTHFDIIVSTSSFLSYSIMDIVGYLATIILGFFFTYIISISSQKDSKKMATIEEAINLVQEDLAKIINYIIDNKNKTTTTDIRTHILTLSLLCDKDFNLLLNLYKSLPDFDKTLISNMKKGRSNFHYILTCDNINLNNIIAEDYLTNCIEKYYFFKQSLFALKSNLYI